MGNNLTINNLPHVLPSQDANIAQNKKASRFNTERKKSSVDKTKEVGSTIRKNSENPENTKINYKVTKFNDNSAATLSNTSKMNRTMNKCKIVNDRGYLKEISAPQNFEEISKNFSHVEKQANGTYKSFKPVDISNMSGPAPKMLLTRIGGDIHLLAEEDDAKDFQKWIEAGGDLGIVDEHNNPLPTENLSITVVVVPPGYNQILFKKIQDYVLNKEKELDNEDVKKLKKKNTGEVQYEKTDLNRLDAFIKNQKDRNETRKIKEYFYEERLFLEKTLDKISEIKNMKSRSAEKKDLDRHNQQAEEISREIKK